VAVNLASALERCSGDTELLTQVISETFEKAKTEQLQHIRTALQNGDHAGAHFHAHSIKGASATIGFDGLSKAAKALDDLVKGGTVEGSQPLVEELQEQLDLACDYWDRHTKAIANALERCGDDQELFYQIAKEMVQDVIPGQVESVEAALRDADAGALHAAALQLLDAAETIGAAPLIDALRPLADSAAAGKLDDAAAMVQCVRSEADGTVAYWNQIEMEG